MRNNYNFIAPYYDTISKVVFGKTIFHAQTCLLSTIHANSSLLIVGGGSGWILEEIAKLHNDGLEIIYIESSEKMIALAKERKYNHNNVSFICLPIQEYQTLQQFDYVFTAFLFDILTEEKINSAFAKIHPLLKTGGKWLYADFIPTNSTKKNWQKMLLKIMYLFFRIVSRIDAKRLTDMAPYFKTANYQPVFTKWHYKNFIQSVIYEKI